jgi:hypothetical protein
MIIWGVFLIGCSLLLPISQGFSPSLGPKIITHLPLPFRHSSFPLTRRWTSVEDKPATSENEPSHESSTRARTLMPLKRASIPFYKLPKAAYRIYTAYVKRLWKETGVSARKTIANDKVRGSIREMQHILTSNEYGELSDGHCSESRDTLLQACEGMLEALPKAVKEAPKGVASKEVVLVSTEGEDAAATAAPKKNRSILFGALMGAAVACWVFSGNHVFTSVFCLMTILGQLEYYRMVMNTGVYPARRISVIGATSMFFTVRRRPFGLSSERILYRFRDSVVLMQLLVLSFHRRFLHPSFIKFAFPCLVCGPWFGFLLRDNNSLRSQKLQLPLLECSIWATSLRFGFEHEWLENEWNRRVSMES